MMRKLAAIGALAGVVALGWVGAASAQTYTDKWSFTDQNGQTVAGQLTGIQNGAGLDAYGLTATVTQASFADLIGSYTVDYYGSATSGSNTYSAVNGVVTYASFELNTFSRLLFFGTDPTTTSFFPQVYNPMTGDSLFNKSVGDQFSIAAAPVPEPSDVALLALPLGVVGLLLARRRKAG